MRLAILSDIHGNLIALETVLADLDAAGGADRLWMLGDVAAFGTRPADCVRRVAALVEQFGKDNTACLRGNTDRYIITGARPSARPTDDEDKFRERQREYAQRDTALNWALAQLTWDDYTFLANLQGETALEAPGCGWVIGYHGTPGDDEGYLKPDTPDEEAADALLDREGRLGVGGHIHMQMDRTLGAWRALNVGSVGMSYERPGIAQYAIFTLGDDGSVHIDLRNIPYDTAAYLAEFEAVGHPAAAWAIGKAKLSDHA